MKKMLILAVLVVALVALSANVALAGTWWQISPDGLTINPASPYISPGGLDFTGDSLGEVAEEDFRGTRSGNTSKTDDWGTRTGYYTESGANPHGGFATTSNYCKTCHAVHDAGTGSYRLLKSGDTTAARTPGEGTLAGLGSQRGNECMYCHNAQSGATVIRPYALGVIATIRGEHTIGATVIPDSNQPIMNRDPNGAAANTFGCYDCHSVHGANVMAFWDAGLILRDDPSNDGVKVTDARAGFAPQTAGKEANYQRNNFCADCHDANASWDTDTSDTNRTSKTSHVTGPAADGKLEVYGVTQTVANTNRVNDRGCRGCHASNDHGANLELYPSGTVSAWPHQTLESKMVTTGDGQTYNGEDPNNDINRAGIIAGSSDTNRGLYKMDAVCLRCHSGDGAGGLGTVESGNAFGVGLTF